MSDDDESRPSGVPLTSRRTPSSDGGAVRRMNPWERPQPTAPSGAAESRPETGAEKSGTPEREGAGEPTRRRGATGADPTQPARRMSLRGAQLTVLLVLAMCAIELVIALAPTLSRLDLFGTPGALTYVWLLDALGLETYAREVSANTRLLSDPQALGFPAVNVFRQIITSELGIQGAPLLAFFLGAGLWSDLSGLITHQFLHGFTLHLAINMLAFIVLGPPLERTCGKLGYLFIFLVCGIAAGLTQFGWAWASSVYITNDPSALNIPMVGASGAIFGLLGADIGRRARALARLPRSGRLVTPIGYVIQSSVAVVMLNLVFELMPFLFPSNIAVAGAAHIGGYVMGLVLGPILTGGRTDPLPPRRAS